MYKLDAFFFEGRWLAWEDNLPEMAAFHRLSGDIRALVTEDLDDKRVATTEIALDGKVFRRWHSWGVRDGERCIQMRLTYLRDVVVPDAATVQAVLM